MPLPSRDSQPRLAIGCRFGTHEGHPVILFPEGMIRVKGTGHSILELCDGQRTVQEIATVLSSRYNGADSEEIGADISTFLEALQRKRIVDY